MTTTTSTPSTSLSQERTDLLAMLRKHRGLFLVTMQGLDDNQATTRTTTSELTLGGLVKHVAQTERNWAAFIVEGAASTPSVDFASIDWSNPPPEVVAFQEGHRMVGGETLTGLLETYAEVAAVTDALVETADLDLAHLLPQAPWFEAGTSWTVRRVLIHVVAETAQHAGHADIIRESLDGQKTMG